MFSIQLERCYLILPTIFAGLFKEFLKEGKQGFMIM